MSFASILNGAQHIGLPTNDMDKTMAFYHGLGFTTAMETVNPANGERVAFLKLNDLMIETYENHAAAETTGAIDHIALDTTDIEQAFALCRAAKLTLLDQEIQFLPFWQNGVRFFTVLGPNAEKIEFCQRL